jgi:hypothetical protein
MTLVREAQFPVQSNHHAMFDVVAGAGSWSVALIVAPNCAIALAAV